MADKYFISVVPSVSLSLPKSTPAIRLIKENLFGAKCRGEESAREQRRLLRLELTLACVPEGYLILVIEQGGRRGARGTFGICHLFGQFSLVYGSPFLRDSNPSAGPDPSSQLLFPKRSLFPHGISMVNYNE